MWDRDVNYLFFNELILNEIWNIKINIKIKMKNKDVYDILKSLEDEPEHNSHEGFNRSTT